MRPCAAEVSRCNTQIAQQREDLGCYKVLERVASKRKPLVPKEIGQAQWIWLPPRPACETTRTLFPGYSALSQSLSLTTQFFLHAPCPPPRPHL